MLAEKLFIVRREMAFLGPIVFSEICDPRLSRTKPAVKNWLRPSEPKSTISEWTLFRKFDKFFQP
jgi:hypothetical protein